MELIRERFVYVVPAVAEAIDASKKI